MYPEIKDRLLELSNIEEQRMLWLNINNNTGLISSYSELFNTLYPELDIEIKEAESNELKEGLSQLKIILDEYKEPDGYDIRKGYDSIILNDPNWQKIVAFTKKMVEDLRIDEIVPKKLD